MLRDVHTEEYLSQLHSSSAKVASVVDMPPLALVPHCLLQQKARTAGHGFEGTAIPDEAASCPSLRLAGNTVLALYIHIMLCLLFQLDHRNYQTTLKTITCKYCYTR